MLNSLTWEMLAFPPSLTGIGLALRIILKKYHYKENNIDGFLFISIALLAIGLFQVKPSLATSILIVLPIFFFLQSFERAKVRETVLTYINILILLLLQGLLEVNRNDDNAYLFLSRKFNVDGSLVEPLNSRRAQSFPLYTYLNSYFGVDSLRQLVFLDGFIGCVLLTMFFVNRLKHQSFVLLIPVIWLLIVPNFQMNSSPFFLLMALSVIYINLLIENKWNTQSIVRLGVLTSLSIAIRPQSLVFILITFLVMVVYARHFLPLYLLICAAQILAWMAIQYHDTNSLGVPGVSTGENPIWISYVGWESEHVLTLHQFREPILQIFLGVSVLVSLVASRLFSQYINKPTRTIVSLASVGSIIFSLAMIWWLGPDSHSHRRYYLPFLYGSGITILILILDKVNFKSPNQKSNLNV